MRYDASVTQTRIRSTQRDAQGKGKSLDSCSPTIVTRSALATERRCSPPQTRSGEQFPSHRCTLRSNYPRRTINTPARRFRSALRMLSDGDGGYHLWRLPAWCSGASSDALFKMQMRHIKLRITLYYSWYTT
jgi:hypothetical protein